MAGAPAIAGAIATITSLLLLAGAIATIDTPTDPSLAGTPSRRLLPPAPSPSPHRHPIAPPPIPPPARRRHKHHIQHWILGFFAGAIAGILGGLAASILLHVSLDRLRRRRRLRPQTHIFSPLVRSPAHLAFLSAPDADAALSSLPVIGRGGSGDVFLKQFPDGSPPLAIKRIRRGPEGPGPPPEAESRLLDKWERQIRSEIKTVGRIRHRNLLPLLAHVARPDRHYLVYEYMKRGSLRGALPAMHWPARRRAALGVAAGLEHLHFHHRPRVIHRDLKPENVLLDDALEARISDFGFAKEMPEAGTHLTMSNVAGTVGYIAPEYYQTMKYTAGCDVYSLGVVLGVVVTGRFPSDEFFVGTEELGMVRWMRSQVGEGNSRGCFDERIGGEGEEEEMELVLRVACFCTADDPLERPSSKDVRVMLAQINHGRLSS